MNGGNGSGVKVRKRKRKYPSGRVSVRWELDLGMVVQPNGEKKRVQLFFPTKDKADEELANAKARRKMHGDSSLTLTEDERIRFVAARDRLASVGGTIEQAVELYVKSIPSLKERVPLRMLLTRFLDAKAQHRARERYLEQLKTSCMAFIRGREEQLAHTVSRDEVRLWIGGNGWAPKTQRLYLGDLHALFSWAIDHGIMALPNPASRQRGQDRIYLPPEDEKDIERLSVDQVKRLIRRAARVPKAFPAPVREIHDRKRAQRLRPGEQEDFREFLWYLVLGIYAGIRPGELGRMTRADVSLKERHAVVGGRSSKTRTRRVVDLSPEACAWLELDVSRGPIVPGNFQRRFDRLREALRIEHWPHDAMRHTFASAHYAHHQNEAALKAQMGHSKEEDTLMQHYRALMTRGEAREFWAYKPSFRRQKVWKKS